VMHVFSNFEKIQKWLPGGQYSLNFSCVHKFLRDGLIDFLDICYQGPL
jgi:hypothetical protein